MEFTVKVKDVTAPVDFYIDKYPTIDREDLNFLCAHFRVKIDVNDKRFIQEKLDRGLHKLTISKVV